MRPGHRASDVSALRDALDRLPPRPPRPVLVVMSGLPGTGKSTLTRRLAEQLPLVVVESDVARRVLVERPTHAPAESARLFGAVHALVCDLLAEGHAVLLDATNVSEDQRRPLYEIADASGASLIVVWVTAPPEVVYERLAARTRGEDPGVSDAGWDVYVRMRGRARPPGVDHYVVDTARDFGAVERRIVGRARKAMGLDAPDGGGTRGKAHPPPAT